MTADRDEQQQEYLARLALAIAEASTASGPEPNNEDLAALLDNRLPLQRRQQVISHLASNSELYSQWQQLLTDLDSWQLSGANVSTMKVSSSQIESIAAAPRSRSHLRSHLRKRWLTRVGGVGTAAAALIVGWFVFSPGKDNSLTLDQAYAEYSPQLEEFLNEQPRMRALPVSVNAETAALLAGIYAGQQKAGIATSFGGIGEAQLETAKQQFGDTPQASQTPAFTRGRWLVIGAAICASDPDQISRVALPPAVDSLPKPQASCDFINAQIEQLRSLLQP